MVVKWLLFFRAAICSFHCVPRKTFSKQSSRNSLFLPAPKENVPLLSMTRPIVATLSFFIMRNTDCCLAVALWWLVITFGFCHLSFVSTADSIDAKNGNRISNVTLCNTNEIKRPHRNATNKYLQCEPISDSNRLFWKLPDLGQWTEKRCQSDREEFNEYEQKCVKRQKLKKYGKRRCYPRPYESFALTPNGFCDLSTSSLMPYSSSPATYMQCLPSSRRRYCGQWMSRPCFSGGIFNFMLQLCLSSSMAMGCPQSYIPVTQCSPMMACPGQSMCMQGSCCMPTTTVAMPTAMYPQNPMITAPIGAPAQTYFPIMPSQQFGNVNLGITASMQGGLCPTGMPSLGPCNIGCPTGSVCMSGACCPMSSPFGMFSYPQMGFPPPQLCLSGALPVGACFKGCPGGYICEQAGCCQAGMNPLSYGQMLPYMSGMFPGPLPPYGANIGPLGNAGLVASVGTPPILPVRARPKEPQLCWNGEDPMGTCDGKMSTQPAGGTYDQLKTHPDCPEGYVCQNSSCCRAKLPACPEGGIALQECRAGCPSGYKCYKGGCCPTPSCPGGTRATQWCDVDSDCMPGQSCIQNVCCSDLLMRLKTTAFGPRLNLGRRARNTD